MGGEGGVMDYSDHLTALLSVVTSPGGHPYYLSGNNNSRNVQLKF